MLTESATAAKSATSAHSASPIFARSRLIAVVRTESSVKGKRNIASWILDFGFWILDYSQSKIQNPKSKISLSDNHVAFLDTVHYLDLGRGLDIGRDRRAAFAVAFANFDKLVALERPDRRGRQPEHAILALQDDMYLHHRAWRKLLAFG